VRSWAKAALDLCTAWSALVEDPNPTRWLETGEQLNGESRSFVVRCDSISFKVAAKPAISSSGNCRAVHEKLAFDLANILCVPVPPVILWDRGEACNDHRLFALSAYVVQDGAPMDEAFVRGLSGDARAELGQILSASALFCIWINNGNMETPGHILVNHSSRLAIEASIIDHAGAMQGPEWGTKFPTPPYLPVAVEKQAVDKAASDIRNINDDAIAWLIDRIPGNYFVGAHREDVRRNLIARKRGIYDLIKDNPTVFPQ